MKEIENKPVENAVPEQTDSVAAEEATPKNPVSEESLINTILRHPGVANLLGAIAEGRSFEDAVRALNVPPPKAELAPEQLEKLMQEMDISEENKAEFTQTLTDAVAGGGLQNAELIAKGLIFEKACAERERKAYLKGRNEKIELEKEAVSNPFKPIPEPEEEKMPNFYFHTPRKSVWDD